MIKYTEDYEREERDRLITICLKKLGKFLLWFYPINFIWSIAAGSKFTFQFRNFMDVIDTWINWNANAVLQFFPYRESFYELEAIDYLIGIFLPYVALFMNTLRFVFAIILFSAAGLSFFRVLKGKNGGMFESEK